jgi:hypothetical protein
MEGILTTLMEAIYAARLEPPPQALPERYAVEVKRLRHLCEVHRTDEHPALRRVVREFLYDWKVILRPLAKAYSSPRSLLSRLRRRGVNDYHES